jgi:hypothetical protein
MPCHFDIVHTHRLGPILQNGILETQIPEVINDFYPDWQVVFDWLNKGIIDISVFIGLDVNHGVDNVAQQAAC